ncbi:hypothetical protein, partial [Pedobacter sp. SYSU D00535]|uniref:hypothetical protein n=1 Tax=Pedobacter sp. SYSU D00535 TaxID=2810308 RepID=UPI001A9748AE
RIHKVGGYSKESKGIDRLAKAFEQDVYEELKTPAHNIAFAKMAANVTFETFLHLTKFYA